MFRSLFTVLILLLPAAAADVDFVRDISPIFSKRCLVCHGAKMHQSEFRLDRRADALRGGASGVAAIVPGSSEKSLLIRYISGADPKLVMPPGPTRLPEREQTLLRNWIDAGAVWPESGPTETTSHQPDRKNHWAFQPRRTVAVPTVKNTAWVRNAIDAFVLEKLEAKGWHPSAAATDQQLMRRLYLNLTGLPPTLREQEQFRRSPDLKGPRGSTSALRFFTQRSASISARSARFNFSYGSSPPVKYAWRTKKLSPL